MPTERRVYIDVRVYGTTDTAVGRASAGRGGYKEEVKAHGKKCVMQSGATSRRREERGIALSTDEVEGSSDAPLRRELGQRRKSEEKSPGS